jgi:Transposase DDE domain group 1
VSQDTTTQCCLFGEMFSRRLEVSFDEPSTSSDGGAILLGAVDRRLSLTSSLAECLKDWRQPGKVRHGLLDLLRERVMALACGYPDTNDAGRLAEDPVLKLVVGRDPVSGEALASQPTLSRFERGVSARELMGMGVVLAEKVIGRHRKRLRRRARLVTIDFDQTHDETHGSQQLALFNGFYGVHCYLPLLGFIRFDEEAEQYLVCALLRSGTAPSTQGLLPLLRRLVPRLRKAFPKARLRLRLDAGFPSPELLEYLDREGLEYVIGLAKNEVLKDWTRDAMARARRDAERTGESARHYGVCRYGAHTWNRLRRVIYKAEVTVFPERALRENLRLVVTNLETLPASQVWEEEYCARGDVENRIKELKDGLAIDRTSCSSFLANQFRVLMTAAAYVLLQELRLKARRTAYARAQITTLRDALLKIGARVVTSVRRIVIHLPESCPAQHAWMHIAGALGGRAG